MKWLIILTVLVTPGCAVYTVATTASTLTTGKSIGDHTVSQITGYDCSLTAVVISNDTHSYYCERAREPGTTYNRNSF